MDRYVGLEHRRGQRGERGFCCHQGQRNRWRIFEKGSRFVGDEKREGLRAYITTLENELELARQQLQSEKRAE